MLAVETFLADIAQNVAGDRVKVEALAPYGVDPHEFEPAPQDMVKLAESQVIIVNGGGVEGWLQKAVASVGGQHQVIAASDGLASRSPREGEAVELGAAARGGGVTRTSGWTRSAWCATWRTSATG